MTETLTPPAAQPERLFLIDGSGYIFRAYHALPPLTRKSDGLPVGAVSGFCNMLWKLVHDMKGQGGPTHVAVIFDPSGPNFRHALYPEYKANRPPAPEDLIPQFPLVRDASRAFGLPAIEMKGFEADDIIATYARQAEARGIEVVIVSSDKDLMQLVTDKVSLMDPVKSTHISFAQVEEKFGVTPDKVIDVQALIGDPVDNVPGAPGIGVKTAAQLMAEYGDLDTLLARAGEIKQPKRRETLQNHADQIRLSRELVRLKTDIEGLPDIETLNVVEPSNDTLVAFLDAMEFRSLARRIGGGAVPSKAPRSWDAPVATVSYGTPTTVSDAVEGDGPLAVQIAAAKGPIHTDAYLCIQDAEALKAYVARAFAARIVAFDTETDALSATHAGLVGVSLAIGPNDACYVPLGHRAAGGLDLGGSDLKQIPMAEAIAILKPLLEAPEVLKVGQNIKYDLSVMARHGIMVAPYDDTMLLSYVVSAGLNGHGMDALSEQYLGHTPISFKSVVGTGKAQKSFAEVELKPATAYAAEDADVTLRLWQILKPKVASDRLLTVYETLERAMPEVLSGMELSGVKIDRARLVQLSQTFGLGMAELEQKAHQVAGQNFNLGSPKQLGEILFEVMAIPGGKKTATGAWSTDVSVLEDLAAKGYELPQILMDWRQMAKLKSTYTDALAEAARPDTDRVHTSYQLAATTTGRLSSSDPNLQNIPVRNEMGRQIRTAFIAEPGHVLVSADYSQIELRLLAHIGDIPQLKRAFAEGLDIHAMTASEMFGVPLSEMTSEIRRRAKAINFGIIYGISAFGLAAQLSIPQGEARDYIALYFKRFPGIQDYMEDIKAKVKEDAFVTTLFGRKIHIPDIRAKGAAQRAFAERAAINAPIQGAASDIIRRAMMKIPHAIAHLDAKMLLQVHDELVFEVRGERAEELIQIIRPIMSNAAAPAVHLSVPLDVEAKAGKTWDEAH